MEPPTDAIARALRLSNGVWIKANESASDQGLVAAKTGQDLASNVAAISDLRRQGEHWTINPRRYHIDWIRVTSRTTAEAQVSKDETARLYQGTTLVELLDGPYTVQYWLSKQPDGWKVARTTVTSTNNRVQFQAASPTPTAAPAATATSAPVPTPPGVATAPAPSPGYSADGSFTDSGTGMRVAISNVQGVQTEDPTLPSGYSLVAFYVRISNGDTSPHDYNEFDFSCIDEGNQQHSATFLPTPYSDAELSAGTMAAADSRAGWDGCEIPTSSKLRIMWDDGGQLTPPANVWPGPR